MELENEVQNNLAPVPDQAKLARHLLGGPEVTATATVTQLASPPQPQPQPQQQVESPALEQLLSIADGYFAAGAIHQAMEMYFELAGEHCDTREAAWALRRLMEIAKQFQHAGKLRQARALYERLV